MTSVFDITHQTFLSRYAGRKHKLLESGVIIVLLLLSGHLVENGKEFGGGKVPVEALGVFLANLDDRLAVIFCQEDDFLQSFFDAVDGMGVVDIDAGGADNF